MVSQVLYIQFGNPASYPPLLHSSRILAQQGWDVRMLGVCMDGGAPLRSQLGPRIKMRLLRHVPAGWRRRLQFAWFTLSAIIAAWRDRPDWVYASDSFSAPAALAIRRLGVARIVYHEHDARHSAPSSVPMKLVLAAWRRLAREADLCVVPNDERASAFLADTGRSGPVQSVWNCPSKLEVGAQRMIPTDHFLLYYHGNLNEELLPRTLLAALKLLPEYVRFRAIGYETIGSRGFSEAYIREAERLGVADRVQIVAPMDRSELLSASREAHVGVVLTPANSPNVNMRTLAGASNKAFDYLAAGLAVLVSEQREWRELYVDTGCGVACDPSDPYSIVEAVRILCEQPRLVQEMGERGRQLVLNRWNYELKFQPVLEIMQNRGGNASVRRGEV